MDILNNGMGYVEVSPHNIEEASIAILKILTNTNIAEHLSKEVRKSDYTKINYDYHNTWSKILENPCKNYCLDISPKNAYNLRLFLSNIASIYNDRQNIQFSRKYLIKQIVKSILCPLFPIKSLRRQIVVKIYQSIKNIIK